MNRAKNTYRCRGCDYHETVTEDVAYYSEGERRIRVPSSFSWCASCEGMRSCEVIITKSEDYNKMRKWVRDGWLDEEVEDVDRYLDEMIIRERHFLGTEPRPRCLSCGNAVATSKSIVVDGVQYTRHVCGEAIELVNMDYSTEAIAMRLFSWRL